MVKNEKMKSAIFAIALTLATTISRGQAANTQPGFAVVELFTSEGCSSCPSAETALAAIAEAGQPNVYVMEFHVDYWDHLGWKDAYSRHEYTLRQQKYVQQLHLGSTYTPQAVVNGTGEMVGSNRQQLTNAINQGLAAHPTNNMKASAIVVGNKVQVNYTASAQQGQLINIALVQKSTETDVKRGENSGRKLKHMNVVRELQTITIGKTTGMATLTLPDGLSANDCLLIAFCQNGQTGEISCATACGL